MGGAAALISADNDPTSGPIGCFVDPIEPDVRGRGLVTIADARVPVEDVMAMLKDFDPEDLL